MKGLKDFFRERVAGISKVDPNNPEKGNKGVILGNVILRVFDDMTQGTILKSGQIFV